MGCDCHYAVEVKIGDVWHAVLFEISGFRILQNNDLCLDYADEKDESEAFPDTTIKNACSLNTEFYVLTKHIFGDSSWVIGVFLVELTLRSAYRTWEIFSTTERDYIRFAKIAGVRNICASDVNWNPTQYLYEKGEYYEPRDFPSDISNAVANVEYDHTPTHFYSYEIASIPELKELFGGRIELISDMYPDYRILVFFDS